MYRLSGDTRGENRPCELGMKLLFPLSSSIRNIPARGALSSGLLLEQMIDLPSGSQFGSDPGKDCNGPPEEEITETAQAWPKRTSMKAIWDPSGDHRGP